MRIAFDLDNTLLQTEHKFPLEVCNLNPLRKLLGYEPIRKGFKGLVKTLKQEKHQIWVYTSSARPVSYIRAVFWMYGIHIHGVVNYDVHINKMRKTSITATKYPPAFKIDYLVDDSEGVKLEGACFGFNVIIVDPKDQKWVQKIKNMIIQSK